MSLIFACTPENNNNGGGNTQPTVVELTGIALTEHEITLEKGGNKVLEVKFTPENATNKLLTWVSPNTSIVTVTDGVVVGVATGSTEIIVKSGNLTDKCQVTVVISATSVDLGLSFKWAECNLGASSPEENGAYYAWGEVEPYYSSQDPLTWKDGKTGYNRASYKWCNGHL